MFLSQPDGTYRFEPLPRLAQIAPLQGMVAGDFDGDGHADIYAVQNSYAPIPSVGRFDGGLSQLLRGDGRGHFTPVPPAESGLVVPGRRQGAGRRSISTATAGRTSSSPGTTTPRWPSATTACPAADPLRIALRGPAGNPTAVGRARSRVELADGSTQTSEVYAGSGYYSQSTAGVLLRLPPDANPAEADPRALAVGRRHGACGAAAGDHAQPFCAARQP